ncbi:hypothetical protein [Bradyrhizobium australiense]|uniref:Uncharacterized protein n=1 Tax=Bradyrhizobium australiense TaxID=2721161 RepID=A0A7Y4GV62_9BRAD|nr:hypothetical protein [Bradyrhizobium australiense]NOJ42486.1 hypothetical protein [Bradyrhizobium australiense]
MSPENPPENKNGSRPSISPGLQSALVFMLLGPVLGVLAALSVVTVMIGGYHVDSYGIPIAFFFSLIVCAITAPVDGVLAYAVPISMRAPLTMIVGAAVAVGLCLFLGILLGSKMMPPLHMLIPIAVIGALNTGTCSLLAYYYYRRKA